MNSTPEQELARQAVVEWLGVLPLQTVELHEVNQPEWNLLYSIIADKFSTHYKAREAKIAKEAVNKELSRLDGFIDIAGFPEDVTKQMHTWVSNSKWALVAPEGENLYG